MVTARDTAEKAWFVVRSPGLWTLAPLPAQEPEPVDFARVAELLKATAPSTQPTDASAGSDQPSDFEPWDLDHPVRPVWTVVGRIVGGAFVVGNGDGEVFRLGASELSVLDRIIETTTARQLDDTAPVELRRALAVLVRARCLLAEPIPEGATSTPPEAVNDAPAEPQPPIETAESRASDDDSAASPTGSAEPTPIDELIRPHPTLGQRVRTAYRLSGKLRPVREAIDKVRGQRE